MPSRDDIVAFVARERDLAGPKGPPKIGKREIARAFGLLGSDKIGLKKLLKEMEADGTIERRRKRFAKAGQLEATLIAEVFSRDRDGDLLAKPVEWNEALGSAPTIRLDLERPRRERSPAPGLGDRVLVQPRTITDEGEPGYRGRIIKVLPRARQRVLGIFQAGGDGGTVLPVDKKSAGRGSFIIRAGNEGEAKDGDLVAVELLGGTRLGSDARIVEKIGRIGSEQAVSLIAIHAHKLPHVFSAAALAEAAAAAPCPLGSREDWRALPLVTIDPADAKDHDDAVFAEPDDDPDNKGGHRLFVAIADVAAYVKPGGALDREALERGNSVYFPDRVVPMLPERISNDLCSLKPGVDRPALALRIWIDGNGRKLRQTVHRVLMRSKARLSYPQAQAAIDGFADAETSPLLDPVLRPLWAAYDALKQARATRQPLDLDLPERKILLDAKGEVASVVTPERLDAHRLIEEFMILANVATAELLESRRQVLVYRAHAEPSVEKLHNLAEFLQTIGIKLAKGQVLSPAQFNGILARVAGTEHEQIVNDVVLRTQAQAEYTPENYGHFGLHLRRYAHFTSPIRRYADLIVHRAIIKAYQLGSDGLPDMSVEQLGDVAHTISMAERRAMAAERETADRLIAAFLADRVGATFTGRIAGVTRAGLFVKLTETGADGFLPAATLGDEYYRFEEAQHALVGSRSRHVLRLGDIVTVELVEVAPVAGALRFELVREGRRRPQARPSPAKHQRSSRRRTRAL